MRYLLDTTLLIDHAHGMPEARRMVMDFFASPNELLTCDAVVAEALSGGDEDHRAAVSNLIRVLEYISTHPDAARWAGERRRQSGKSSHRTLGDALIAGVAWYSNATVVTRNPDEFVAQGIPVLTYG